MTNTIHPTAVIDAGVTLGDNCRIGPYCVITGPVTLGNGVTLKSHVTIEGRTTIGDSCIVYPFASLGTAPQDLKYRGEDTQLVIGSGNTIREHVTMNLGTVSGGGVTRVGNNNLFMMACHVAHDCVIGNNVIMANNATLGGHVTVGDSAVLGGLSAVHQFVRIGEGAVVGGMSGVENDVIPYGRVKGERAHLDGLNLVGLERRGLDKDDIRAMQRAFNLLFHGDGTFEERIEKTEADFQNDPRVQAIVAFARGKNRFPICQPLAKAA